VPEHIVGSTDLLQCEWWTGNTPSATVLFRSPCMSLHHLPAAFVTGCLDEILSTDPPKEAPTELVEDYPVFIPPSPSSSPRAGDLSCVDPPPAVLPSRKPPRLSLVLWVDFAREELKSDSDFLKCVKTPTPAQSCTKHPLACLPRNRKLGKNTTRS
jgi:hypothetical protein